MRGTLHVSPSALLLRMAEHHTPRVSSRPTRKSNGIFSLSSSIHNARCPLRLRTRGLLCVILLAVAASSLGAEQPTSLAAGKIAADTPEAVRIRGIDADRDGEWTPPGLNPH